MQCYCVLFNGKIIIILLTNVSDITILSNLTCSILLDNNVVYFTCTNTKKMHYCSGYDKCINHRKKKYKFQTNYIYYIKYEYTILINQCLDKVMSSFFFIDTSKLLNTIMHAKIINTQFEVGVTSACLHFNNPSQDKPIEDKNANVNNTDVLLSPVPVDLQSSILEESNFKNQFFITRSSFQVNICHSTIYW